MKVLQIYILILSLMTSIFAQQTPYQKIIPFDGKLDDSFGSTVSISDGYLGVGTHLRSETAYLSGCVYLYKLDENNSWGYSRKLIPPELNDRDRLGTVKLLNNHAFIGAWTKEVSGNERGKVWVYDRSDTIWNLIQQIVPQPLCAPGGDFGYTIEANEKFLFITALTDTVNGYKAGSVYVFKKDINQWIQHQRIRSLSNVDYQFFGFEVDIDDSILVISAPADSNKIGRYGGTVYFYKLLDNYWENFLILYDQRGEWDGYFGNGISIYDSLIAIGSTRSVLTNKTGKVQIYKFNQETIKLIEEIIPSDSTENNNFGGSVKLIEDSLFISAIGSKNNFGYRTGAAYLYIFDGKKWIENSKYLPDVLSVGASFGWDLDFNAGYLCIAAPEDINSQMLRTGALYVFSDRLVENDDLVFENMDFNIYQNYPNPFNPTTIIRYDLKEFSLVRIKVYDLLGREILTLVNEEKPKGSYQVNFFGGQLASGLYIYNMRAGDFVKSKKMLLVK